LRVPIGVIKEGERNPEHWFLLIGGPTPPEEEFSEGSFASDGSGNFYFGTYSVNSKTSLRRYSKQGTRQISKIFSRNVSGLEWFALRTFNVSAPGNLYITNLRTSGSNYISKRDSSGNEQWRLNYTTGLTPPGQGIDSSENSYMAFSGFQSPNAAVLSKLNSSGSVLLQRMLRNNSVLDGEGSETADGIFTNYAPAIDTAGNIIVSGSIQKNFQGGSSPIGGTIFIKYNSSGTLQWQKKLVATPGAFFTPISTVTDSSNNIYSLINDSSLPGVFIVKLDTSGNILWQRRIQGVSSDYSRIFTDSFSNLYIPLVSGNSLLLAKYNSLGQLQWQRLASISSYSLAGGTLSLVSDNTFAVQGRISPIIGNKSYIVLSLPTDGSVSGSYKIEGQALTISAGNIVDSPGSATISDTAFLVGSPPTIFGGDPGSRSIGDISYSDTIVKV
jgi:hypothetical protein